jgi:hypothetical protein
MIISTEAETWIRELRKSIAHLSCSPGREPVSAAHAVEAAWSGRTQNGYAQP